VIGFDSTRVCGVHVVHSRARLGVFDDSKITEFNCPVWLCKECAVYVQIQAWLNERGAPQAWGFEGGRTG